MPASERSRRARRVCRCCLLAARPSVCSACAAAMQGFLQNAKARATELAADAELAAKGLVATVEAAIEAPAEASEAVVVPIAHGGPTGLHFAAPSDKPGEPVVVDSIASGSPIFASHPLLKEGSRLVAINMVRRSMTCTWIRVAEQGCADDSIRRRTRHRRYLYRSCRCLPSCRCFSIKDTRRTSRSQ